MAALQLWGIVFNAEGLTERHSEPSETNSEPSCSEPLSEPRREGVPVERSTLLIMKHHVPLESVVIFSL